MLNSKELYNEITQLFALSEEVPYVVGNGILTSMKIGFDEKKLEHKKQEIADILQSLGVDEQPLIKLSCLTKLKDGQVWNKLESIEDFQALELLLACSHACGFIINDYDTILRNILELGDIPSILISRYGRIIIGNEGEWLRQIREVVIDRMFFFTNPENIKFAANGSQKAPSLHK